MRSNSNVIPSIFGFSCQGGLFAITCGVIKKGDILWHLLNVKNVDTRCLTMQHLVLTADALMSLSRRLKNSWHGVKNASKNIKRICCQPIILAFSSGLSMSRQKQSLMSNSSETDCSHSEECICDYSRICLYSAMSLPLSKQ